MKPKLLIIELWGLGDLAIATPFLRAAAEKFDVTLLAKPYALDLQPRLWPDVRVETFIAPWTAFKNKYHLWHWPLLEMSRLCQRLLKFHFDFGLSARWDPRDHLLLKLVGARERLGFPRLSSRVFLTRPLARPQPEAHHYESWRILARALDHPFSAARKIFHSCPARNDKMILIHSGAATVRPRLAAGKLPEPCVPIAAGKFPGADRVRSRTARMVAAFRRAGSGDAAQRDGTDCAD